MILEGIVTTISAQGALNIAPMGPHLFPPYVLQAGSLFELRPYQTTHTFANLKAHPEGVLHVHDDVLLLARAAVGVMEPLPSLLPAHQIRGYIIADTCRAYEFRVVECDDNQPRVRLAVEVVKAHTMREFFGFNRAMNAVLEAAILATRTAFTPRNEIDMEYRRLAVIVEKTGGPREKEAFGFLQAYVARAEENR